MNFDRRRYRYYTQIRHVKFEHRGISLIMKVTQVDFEHGKVSTGMLHTALPMLAAQILNLLYSIVDRIYIGKIPGEGTLALGGIGLCFPLIIIVTAFTNLYGTGGSPLCSMARGKGNLKAAADYMNIAFSLLIYTSLLLFVVGEVFSVPLLRLFGASDQSLPFALSYLRIYLIGTTFTMISAGLNPYINAQGFSSVGMFTVVIGAGVNILLDPLFIFVFKMSVSGAALATIISQGLSALFVLRFLRSDRAELRLSLMNLGELGKHAAQVRQILSLGTASFIMQLTNSLVSISCNSVLSHLGGDLYVSVMTIISSVRQILDTPIMAIAEGTSPIISFNYGASHPHRIKEAFRLMFIIAMIYSALTWGLIWLFPRMFIRIFADNEELIAAAVPCLHLYFFAFVFQTFQYGGQTMFKSLNKKKHAIFFSLFRKVIMVVPLTYLLPYAFHAGVNGVFMAEPISNVIGGAACFITMLMTIMPELRKMETNINA